MYKFFLKKNFCDGWDNLFTLILPNIIMMVFVAAFVCTATFLPRNVVIILLIVLVVLLNIFMTAFAECAKTLASFRTISIKDFFVEIPRAVKHGVLFAAVCLFSFVVFAVGIPFYLNQATSQSSMIGFVFAVVLAWLGFFEVLALQWFFAIKALVPSSFLKMVKKCFLIMADNFGFSVFMFFYNIFLLAVSVFFVGLMPSFCGMVLSQTNALRLRLYKYDYLENCAEQGSAKKIPWRDLIKDDKETLGERNWKSFLFPWK